MNGYLLASSPENVHAQKQDLDRIIGNWESMREAVVTVDLRCQHLLLTCSSDEIERSRTREELSSFIRECLVPFVGLPDTAARMRQATKKFLGRHYTYQPLGLKGGWSTLHIVEDGDSLRNESISDSGNKRIRVRSKNDEVEYFADIRQARIRVGHSQIRMHRLSDIRLIPDLKSFPDTSDLKLEVLDDNRSRVTVMYRAFEFDPATGFVSHAFGTNRRADYLFEQWLFLPRLINGVEVPGLSASVRYRTDSKGAVRLEIVDVYIIETIVLNNEIAVDRFAVSVPKGTVLVNVKKHLKFGHARRSFVASSDIEDFKAYMPRLRP